MKGKDINLGKYLFDNDIIKKLDYSKTDVFVRFKLSANFPGENLLMRPLCRNDYRMNYIELLSQLTSTGKITEEQFLKRFDSMKICKDIYYIVVMEDVTLSRVIASGSIVIESHIRPNLSIIQHGRIEDIVVSSTHRKKQHGKLLLDTLVLVGTYINCSTISLECKDSLINFYTQFNFQPQYHLKPLSNRYKKNLKKKKRKLMNKVLLSSKL